MITSRDLLERILSLKETVDLLPRLRWGVVTDAGTNISVRLDGEPAPRMGVSAICPIQFGGRCLVATWNRRTAILGMASAAPTWESLPLSTGYSPVAGYPLEICEWGGIVHIRGAVLIGSTGTWDNVASVPEKYRPTQQQFLGGQITSGSSGTTARTAALLVQPNGRVGVASGYVTAIAGNILPVVGYWFKN